MEYAGESPQNVSASLFFNEETGHDAILPLGIVDALADDVPASRILLDTVVEKIEWGEEGSTVRCGGGSSHFFTADYVICTLPVSTVGPYHDKCLLETITAVFSVPWTIKMFLA